MSSDEDRGDEVRGDEEEEDELPPPPPPAQPQPPTDAAAAIDAVLLPVTADFDALCRLLNIRTNELKEGEGATNKPIDNILDGLTLVGEVASDKEVETAMANLKKYHIYDVVPLALKAVLTTPAAVIGRRFGRRVCAYGTERAQQLLSAYTVVWEQSAARKAAEGRSVRTGIGARVVGGDDIDFTAYRIGWSKAGENIYTKLTASEARATLFKFVNNITPELRARVVKDNNSTEVGLRMTSITPGRVLVLRYKMCYMPTNVYAELISPLTKKPLAIAPPPEPAVVPTAVEPLPAVAQKYAKGDQRKARVAAAASPAKRKHDDDDDGEPLPRWWENRDSVLAVAATPASVRALMPYIHFPGDSPYDAHATLESLTKDEALLRATFHAIKFLFPHGVHQ